MNDQESSDVRREHRLLEEVIAAAPVVVYAFGNGAEEPHPLWVCPNVTRIMGYPVEQTRTRDWWRDVVHPEDLTRVRGWRRECMEGAGGVLEYRVLHADGAYRWIRDELRHPNGSGDLDIRGVGSWMDITEKRALAEELLEARKIDAVGRLAGGVAHDFNNLLTVILSHATLLKDSLSPADDEALEEVEGILSAAGRASELTSQLLSFGQRQLLSPRAVDLDEAVQELIPLMERVLGEAVELEVDLDAHGASVWTDPGRLEQAAMNLALNAREAMPGGGRCIISTGVVTGDEPGSPDASRVPDGSLAHLTLRDSGEGMPDEVQARAFDPFFTTREQGRGTGLGLAMVHGFVKQSGGDVRIESAPGEGTAVTLYLPLVGPEGGSP